MPGTELGFETEVQYDRAMSLFGKARVAYRVARFRQINVDDPHMHHDALEFPDGLLVLITRLVPGQRANVLQLPAGTPEPTRHADDVRTQEAEPIAN